jgi:hypothetical protein
MYDGVPVCGVHFGMIGPMHDWLIRSGGGRFLQANEIELIYFWLDI